LGCNSAGSIDLTTGDFWQFRNFLTGRWRRSDGDSAQVTTNGSDPVCGESASAYDTARDRIFVRGGGPDDASDHYTIGSNTWAAANVTGSTAGVSINESGMVYVPSLDAYLFRSAASGGNVYSIDASSFVSSLISTTGGSGVPVTANGPYNKFLYCPRLGGCVYIPVYDEDVWFLRVEDVEEAIPGDSGGEPPTGSPLLNRLHTEGLFAGA